MEVTTKLTWRAENTQRRKIIIGCAIAIISTIVVGYQCWGNSVREEEAKAAWSLVKKSIDEAKLSRGLPVNWEIDSSEKSSLIEGHEGGLGIRYVLYCKTDQPERAVGELKKIAEQNRIRLSSNLLWYTHNLAAQSRIEQRAKDGAIVAIDFPATPTNIGEHIENGL